MLKKIFAFIFFIASAQYLQAQELQARVTVLANRISTQVDKKIFQTLQSTLTNFLNNRKWTADGFQPGEKIKCSFPD